MNDNDIKTLFNDGFLFDIDVSFWTATRKLNEEDMGLEDVSEAYTLGKKLLIPARIMQAFRRIESRARALLDNSSFKFPLGNAKYVPKPKFIKVIEELKAYQSEYKALVEDLILNYQAYREEMRPVYLKAAEEAYETKASKRTIALNLDPALEKAMFIEQFMARINSCYPPAESLRDRFAIVWDVYEIALPRLQTGDADQITESLELHNQVEADYRNQMHTKINAFVEEVVSVLRQEAIQICKHVATNIAEGKVVTNRTIQSLTTFMDKFKDMNFVGDRTIEESLESVRKELLDLHTPAQISDNAELKVELQRRLNLIADQASSMTDISSVTGQYKRKINWQE
jgi:hypothetical protein